MREAKLLAPTRAGHAHGPTGARRDDHDRATRPDVGVDATSCLTRSEGTATVFVVVDHCASECIGVHAAKPGTRFEAVEPLRQGIQAVCAEKLKPEDLVRAAELEGELAAAQRVGYLLEHIGQRAIAEPLAARVDQRKPRLVPLRPGRRIAGRRDPRWHLAVNEKIELDAPRA